ncbi:DUF434 domain-containing protein [Methanotrichaceae archaeon M04Ac]|uniref:DUF434 domain-containing protein n=1 Tax=Candidatus Methanocrinis alkalitolerans TaxID=3033395 RepID=A0ABT5XGY9_9EURY|nr:DUF434 domain-containing protein [Methanothrix sp.]MDF0593893.1 DUF434 domain-containing protein [Candidatus Methanocrinis alkalitolerans]
MRRAAEEVRYLLDRGYPSGPAVRFVSDHRRLPREDRFVLTRVAVPSAVARSRRKKRTPINELSGRTVAVDGYNVLITVESLLAGAPVYLCDDGFLRDVRGIFRRYHLSDITDQALSEIFSLLKESGVGGAMVLLDQQISRSGELASEIRERMAELGVLGSAKTAPDVDRRLKRAKSPVATGDGTIIDASAEAVDIPGEVANRRGIEPIIL